MQPVTYNFSGSNRLFDSLSLIIFALFLYPLLMTVGTGLMLLEIPGTDWIKSYGTEADIANFWLYLLMTVSVGAIFALSLVTKAGPRNLLALDELGLTYRFMGMRHTWPWRDIESVEAIRLWAGASAGRITVAGQFGWGARIGLLFMNGIASAQRLAITLPDFYEQPIEDIVAGINDYRDKVLGIKRPAEDAAQPSPRLQAAAAGQPVTFSMPKTMSRFQRWLILGPIVICLAAFSMVAVLIPGEGESWGDLWNELGSERWELLAMFPLLLMTMFIGFFTAYRTSKPENNSLSLDPSGLTYMRHGQRYAWPWKDVSAFEHRKLAGISLTGRRQVITFAAPGKDWTWGWIRRLYGLPKAPPAVVIDGVYDATVKETAATLNAYRERALGGAD